MKSATFYLLSNDTYQYYSLNALEQLVCEIAAEHWRNNSKRILIACEDKQQAIRLDKALWICPTNSFIPHNLSGEGPKEGAPIEIAWPQQKYNNGITRDILINLRFKFADFVTTFTKVLDFIPYEESLKQLARERYKAYRLAGFNLNTITWGNK